jgi:hypothetical protein
MTYLIIVYIISVIGAAMSWREHVNFNAPRVSALDLLFIILAVLSIVLPIINTLIAIGYYVTALVPLLERITVWRSRK